MEKKLLTLCIVSENNKVLLGMKKRRFGAGLWNGFGGKVEKGENIDDSIKRELEEEAGIKALEISKRGILDFEFKDNPKVLEVHIYSILKYEGEPKETEEMKPEWFGVGEIPFDKMWPSDVFWLPLFLDNKKFKGRFLFDRPSGEDYFSKIIEKELIEVDII